MTVFSGLVCGKRTAALKGRCFCGSACFPAVGIMRISAHNLFYADSQAAMVGRNIFRNSSCGGVPVRARGGYGRLVRLFVSARFRSRRQMADARVGGGLRGGRCGALVVVLQGRKGTCAYSPDIGRGSQRVLVLRLFQAQFIAGKHYRALYHSGRERSRQFSQFQEK